MTGHSTYFVRDTDAHADNLYGCKDSYLMKGTNNWPMSSSLEIVKHRMTNVQIPTFFLHQTRTVSKAERETGRNLTASSSPKGLMVAEHKIPRPHF